MPKANKPGGDKPASNNTPSKQQEAPKIVIAQTPGSGSTSASPARGRQRGKNRKPAIGGTAVPGAKSMQPKEMPTSQTPNAQQQAETYNRDMRRRMQHMGTGPYSEPAPALKKAQKRSEERKKRQEEAKKTSGKKGSGRKIKLGRRNTYFVLGTIAFVVVVIVVALILRHL